MRTHAPLAALALAACVHNHPVTALERQARKQDKDWSEATAKDDGKYWITRTDAIAVAAEAAQSFAPVVVLDADRVQSDWLYSFDAGIDEGGEWHAQERTRINALVVGDQELGLSMFKRSESRRIRAGLDPSGWGGGDAPWTNAEATAELNRIEADHLSRPQLVGDEERLRRVATELSPKDYGVVVDEPGRLVVERNLTEGRTSKDGSQTAAWHSRSRIELLITTGNAVDVQLRADHRFDTEKGAGEWQPAEAVDLLEAQAWIKRLLAEPRSGLVLSAPKRKAPPAPTLDETPPPKIPRLRGMPEIQTLIVNQALDTATGDFRICVAGALIPLSKPGGGLWDPDPADPDAAPPDGPRTAEEALGPARGLERSVDPLPDLLQVKRDIPIVTRESAVQAMSAQVKALEAKQEGFSRLLLPSNPDVGGRFESGARTTLAPVADRLAPSWESACIEKRYKTGLPIFTLTLWDEEPDGKPEPIAECTLDLATILAQGDRGVACGESRVFLDTTYLFDMPQIDLVGLPEARE